MISKKSVADIIRSTREISLPHFGNVTFEEKDDSGANPVTEIDKKIELYLKEKLSELEPSIGFVGEEFGGDAQQDHFWICDPIDGTDAYIRGLPFCTTMLALIKDGVVEMGFIYDFCNDIIYSAEPGKGAYKNDQKIEVKNRDLRSSMITIGTKNKALVGHLLEKYHNTQAIGAGFKFIMIAQGSLDAVMNVNGFGGLHDYAPGSLIASEAGAIITNMSSNTYDVFDLDFICATSTVHDQLKKDVKDFLNN